MGESGVIPRQGLGARCTDGTCGACRSCQMRQHWRDGVFAHRPKTPPWDAWDIEQDAALEALAGTVEADEIARRLSEQFAIPRTKAAVRIRAKRLGVSLWVQGWSLRDVERFFGLDHRAIVRYWVTPGLLQSERWNGRGPFDGWRFTDAEIERFLREHQGGYDVARLDATWTTDPQRRRTLDRFASLARALAVRDPWLTWDQLSRAVGISGTNLERWHRRYGFIPTQRRPGAGGLGERMVRASAIPMIRATIAAYTRANRRAGALRCSRGSAALREVA